MPGGAAGLQNQSGGRKVPGGFDSLPSPPESCLRMGNFRCAASRNDKKLPVMQRKNPFDTVSILRAERPKWEHLDAFRLAHRYAGGRFWLGS